MADDFMTGLAGAAIEMHELFTGFVEAGFTEDQALKLLIGIFSGNN